MLPIDNSDELNVRLTLRELNVLANALHWRRGTQGKALPSGTGDPELQTPSPTCACQVFQEETVLLGRLHLHSSRLEQLLARTLLWPLIQWFSCNETTPETEAAISTTFFDVHIPQTLHSRLTSQYAHIRLLSYSKAYHMSGRKGMRALFGFSLIILILSSLRTRFISFFLLAILC